jgi:hypothetical protein
VVCGAVAAMVFVADRLFAAPEARKSAQIPAV